MKKDFILSLIIGEVAAWLIIYSSKNLNIPYVNFLPVVFPFLCAIGLIIAYFLSKKIPVIYQLAKFILVGGLNFLIDISVLSLLIFSTGITSGLLQSGFKAISFVVAVFNSFFWNKYWTFSYNKNKEVFKEFPQFLTVSTIGLLINVFVDYIFVNKIPVFVVDLKSWAQLGAVIASIAALIWNYLGYKFIVFKKE